MFAECLTNLLQACDLRSQRGKLGLVAILLPYRLNPLISCTTAQTSAHGCPSSILRPTRRALPLDERLPGLSAPPIHTDFRHLCDRPILATHGCYSRMAATCSRQGRSPPARMRQHRSCSSVMAVSQSRRAADLFAVPPSSRYSRTQTSSNVISLPRPRHATGAEFK